MTDVSTFLLFLRVGFSLAVVLAMIWAAARFAKRKGPLATRPRSDTDLDVVARRQLGRRGASLLVVQARHRSFLVGVTDTTVSLVAELDAADAEEVAGQLVDEPPAGGITVVAQPLDDSIDVPSGSPSAAPVAARRESLVDALRDLTVRR